MRARRRNPCPRAVRSLVAACLAASLFALTASAQDAMNQPRTILEAVSGADSSKAAQMVRAFVADGGRRIVALTGLMVDHATLTDTDDDRRKLATDQEARLALHAMVTAVGQPGADREREALRGGIVAALGADLPPAVKAHLIRELRLIGEDDDAPAVAGFLNDEATRDDAAGALVSFAGARSTEALRAALKDGSTDSRLAVIAALGELGDKGSTTSIVRYAEDADETTRVVAWQALGKIGDPAGALALLRAYETHEGDPRDRAGAALIDLCERIGARRREAGLDRALRAIAEHDPRAIRIAAMRIIAQEGDAATRQWLMGLAQQGLADVRKEAIMLLASTGSDGGLEAIRTLLSEGAPAVRADVIKVMRERGEKRAGGLILESIAGERDEQVRIAAIEASPALVGGDAFDALVGALATASPGESAAIEGAFARLSFEGWPGRMTRALATASGSAKLALMRVLVSRHATEAHEEVFKLTTDGDSAVRLAALEAIGELGGPGYIAPLARELARADSSRVRAAVQQSLRRLAAGAADQREAAGPLLTVMREGDDEAAGAAMAVLASIGGPEALAAVIAESRSANAHRNDAAVRALAGWSNNEATGALIAIASEGDRALVHRVLALRGAVRLVGEDRSIADDARFNQLRRLMEAAPRAEEKRLVIGGFKALGDSRGIEVVSAYLDDPELRGEAADAVLTLAGRVARQVEEARKAVERIRTMPELSALHERAEAVEKALGEGN